MKFDEVLRRFSRFFESEGIRYDAPDIAFLMALPGVNREKMREYFSQQGLLKIYDELEKERR